MSVMDDEVGYSIKVKVIREGDRYPEAVQAIHNRQTRTASLTRQGNRMKTLNPQVGILSIISKLA